LVPALQKGILVSADGTVAIVDGMLCGRKSHKSVELWRGRDLRLVPSKGRGTRITGTLTKPVLYYHPETGFPFRASPHTVSKRLGGGKVHIVDRGIKKQ